MKKFVVSNEVMIDILKLKSATQPAYFSNLLDSVPHEGVPETKHLHAWFVRAMAMTSELSDNEIMNEMQLQIINGIWGDTDKYFTTFEEDTDI